ncbi:MAG: succinyl-CoA--3-ketoacid-CoA transferase [Elusimicrobia bacterium GWA2_69_24]|nr:MAG: succinyl-CoA--3-ketoacid-CoA transferase [Elusimicrobia bacterium GWA2_69_24]HBL18593.1 succinyl-CoA--3-ketoacid-CoA transferase [Elusimicrobiota bacterium]
MIDKRVPNAEDALRDLKEGSSILVGGFGVSGMPEHLLRALLQKGTKGLTLISNNPGTDQHGIAPLMKAGMVRKMILSYGGFSKTFEEISLKGSVELEWVPQGTLAERIRAGGAGVGGFYTPTGYGTMVAEGKETRQFDGKWQILELPIRADFSLIKAFRGDPYGNLLFRKTARNFNQVMATAGRTVLAEVEELVELGAIPPDQVHTPGLYVDRIFQGDAYEKPIEIRTTRPRAAVRG